MGRSFFHSWVLFLLVAAPALAQETPVPALSAIPADAAEPEPPLPVVSVLVHHPQSLMSKRLQLSVGPYILSGDRYLSTMGLGWNAGYHLSEESSISAGYISFRSSASKNADYLGAKFGAPLAHDPQTVAFVHYNYCPFYGKFTLGSHIQRFRWRLFAGVHAAKEKLSAKVQSGVVEQKFLLGPSFGTGISFPVMHSIFVGADVLAQFHGKLLAREDSGRRNLLYSLQGGYVF